MSNQAVRLVPLKTRPSKVPLKLLGTYPKKGRSFNDFWQGLPDILAVKNLRLLVDRIRLARKKGKPVMVLFGAHVIKVGLSRYLTSLMEGGWITALATNGAGLIHDFELSFAGHTSEDVGAHLKKGIFGFAKETGFYVNEWAKGAAKAGLGLGLHAGEQIAKSAFLNKELSLFAKAYSLKIPVTVHVAIGTDIIYQHPNCDGAAWGAASFKDFQRLTQIVGELDGGGVVMNWGSAVLMPEVFLKAVAVNCNLGRRFRELTAANFDMINHYRPRVNILERPAHLDNGTAINITGHHEILLPLLAQALVET